MESWRHWRREVSGRAEMGLVPFGLLGRVMGWLSVNQLDGLPDLFGPLLGLSGIESSQLMVSLLS